MPGEHRICLRRRDIAGRSVRWDATRAESAYAQGWWVRETLADALECAARDTAERVLVVDGERRLDCRSLRSPTAKPVVATSMTGSRQPKAKLSLKLRSS
jgi:non-ribosomal peptide synthetase component E (peptide arylation enzyme)